MTWDDIIYVSLLIVSIPLGHLIKLQSSYYVKKYLSTGIGFLIATIVCGRHIVHSLVTVLVNTILLAILPKRWIHYFSFSWCFGYLLFFRLCYIIEFPAPSAYSNAIQLLLTLKLVGVAFEISDAHRNKHLSRQNPDDEQLQLKAKLEYVEPSCCDLFHYAYCFIGLLTGPYYKYRVYNDMLKNKKSDTIETAGLLIRRLKMLPLYIIGFVAVSKYFHLNDVLLDSFYENSFLYRLLFMVPMFFIFRMRFYIAWLLSEAVCISSTLGAYPVACKAKPGQGPTDLQAVQHWKQNSDDVVQYDNETTHNIEPYGCDFAWRVSEGMRSWNMTVQYWMAHHVYKRVPIHNNPLRVALTMAVSAFWHGLHPGYYLSFLTVAPNIVAENAMIRAFHKDKNPVQQKMFEWFSWFWYMRSFEYMSMGFMLLSLKDTLRYWSSIYFFGHIVIVVCFIIGQLSSKKSKKQSAHSQ